MTDLKNSPVTRRTALEVAGRRLVVTLCANDKIEIRHERSRESYKVGLADFFCWAKQQDRWEV